MTSRQSISFFLCLFIAIVSIGLFLTTRFCEFGYSGSEAVVGFAEGCFGLGVPLKTQPQGFWVEKYLFPETRWVPTLDYYNSPLHFLIIPLWIPAVLGLIPVLRIARRARRTGRFGRCRLCDYDLHGNVSGICPECGTKFELRPACPADSPRRGEGA